MINAEEVIKKEKLPDYIGRRKAADVISLYYFPVKHRSLEKWPVKYFLVNNKALAKTVDILSVAQKKMEVSFSNNSDGETNV
jgi:hypothetical protein